MRVHATTTGEGNAPVKCIYHFDSDGDLDALEVLLQGVDIKNALSDQQIADLEESCRAHAKSDYESSKDDARIDAYIERTTV